MTYLLLGKNISGTDSSGKVFSKALVTGSVGTVPGYYGGETYNMLVAKDQELLVPSTGRVYTAKSAGMLRAVKWQYDHTNVTGVPTSGITGLTLKRGSGRNLDAAWKVPDALKSSTNARRASGLKRTWKLDTSEKGGANIKLAVNGSVNATSGSLNLNSFTANGKAYTRQSFHPYAGKPRLKSVTVVINPYNSIGAAGKTPDGKAKVAKPATLSFKVPDKPTIGSFSFAEETGIVSVTVTAAKDSGAKERLWTQYEMKVTDTSASGQQTWTPTGCSGNTANADVTLSYNASNYQSLTAEEYIRVFVRARSRGYAGDSEWTDWDKHDYYLAKPRAVSIAPGKDRIEYTSKDSAGRAIIPVKVNKDAQHPVDSIKLQKLANVTYAKDSEIPGDAAWTDTDSVDDGECTALVADVADLIPDPGNHTWIRIKAWRSSEASLHTYSKAVELAGLYRAAPTASDDPCAIVSTSAVKGGEAVSVVIGYDKASNPDDATGTVIEWSDDAGAWKSTKAPESFEFTFRDSTVSPKATAKGFRKSATIKVRGLSEGTEYWFRAHRYMEDANGNRTDGPSCPLAKCATASIPVDDDEDAEEKPPIITGLVLSAPAFIERGRPCEVSWVLSASEPQESWQVKSGTTVLANGTDLSGACSIPWSRIAPRVSGNRVALSVSVSAGGEHADSQTAYVGIAERPDVLVGASTLTAQPLAFTVESGIQSAGIAWTVRADGENAGEVPDGTWFQADGEPIATGSGAYELAAVAWESSLASLLPDAVESARYQATVTLEPGVGFMDGAAYRVEAVATDPVSGLASGIATASFAVAWAHQAVTPGSAVTVEEAEGEDAHGVMHRAVTIALTPPDGTAAGDVYDLYRVTHDGAQRVSQPEGLPLTSTVTDEYAPYGDAADFSYRAAIRTPDGDVAWDDYEYFLDAQVLRFDFGGRSVELPYDIVVGDSYEKDFELRQHMDGGSEGYWNGSVKRTASLSTGILRIDDADAAEAVRALARHAGPVFVRTPDGSAYEADVQVNGADVSGEVLAVSFDATEVGLTDEFMLPVPATTEGQ